MEKLFGGENFIWLFIYQLISQNPMSKAEVSRFSEQASANKILTKDAVSESTVMWAHGIEQKYFIGHIHSPWNLQNYQIPAPS